MCKIDKIRDLEPWACGRIEVHVIGELDGGRVDR